MTKPKAENKTGPISNTLNSYWLSLFIKPNNESSRYSSNFKYTFQGFLNILNVIGIGSPADKNTQIVIVPSATIEVWNRLIPRAVGENPLVGVKFVREYNTACVELTLQEFIDGRNALLDIYTQELGLGMSDWQAYVTELTGRLAGPKNSQLTRDAFFSLKQLLIETKLWEKLPQSTRSSITYPESISVVVLEGLIQFINQYLPAELFEISQFEFVIPLIKKAYPLPEPQFLVNENGQQVPKPTCDDYIGVCCLYDEIVKEIKPGLNKVIKIYKECLTEIDEKMCLNNTKRYSQSADNADRGKYDGADFYLDPELNLNCDICKGSASIVYCSDDVPFILKNAKPSDIADQLASVDNPVNIEYFDRAVDAQKEYNRRVDSQSCENAVEPEKPTTPDIDLDTCTDEQISVTVSASGCNVSDLVNYTFFIDGKLTQPNSISWDPGPAYDSGSVVTATFNGYYQGSTISATVCNLNLDISTGSYTSGPQSNRSISIDIECPSVSPSPEPSPSPSILTPYAPTVSVAECLTDPSNTLKIAVVPNNVDPGYDTIQYDIYINGVVVAPDAAEYSGNIEDTYTAVFYNTFTGAEIYSKARYVVLENDGITYTNGPDSSASNILIVDCPESSPYPSPSGS